METWELSDQDLVLDSGILLIRESLCRVTAIDKMSSIVWMATLILVVIANLSEIKTHQMRKTTYCNYKPVLIQDEKHIDPHFFCIIWKRTSSMFRYFVIMFF
jgi:hypothetical protein